MNNVHLIHGDVSTESIQTLEDLLARAKAGTLIGIAYVAMYNRREYGASACGEARRNPTFTRGMLAALDDFLGEIARR